MSKGFAAVYIKLVLISCLIVFPGGAFFLYKNNERISRLLDQQLQENLRQVSQELVQALPTPSDMNSRFEDEIRRVLGRFNSASSSSQLVQAGLYKKADSEGVYRLAQNIQIDKKASIALLSTDVFGSAEYTRIRQLDAGRFKFTVPVPSPRSADYVIFLQAVDTTRESYMRGALIQQGLFWGITFIVLMLFIAMFVVHSEFNIPMKHLRNALSQSRKSVLDPSDFGALSDLVRSLEERPQTKEESSEGEFDDASTGILSEQAAGRIYEEGRKSREECYLVFFKPNFAEQYIKTFGRGNRSVIKKMTGDVLEFSLPAHAPKVVTDDLYFLTQINPKEFKMAVEKCQRKFNDVILTLYELGQGKQVPIQTFSAFAISSLSPHGRNFEEAVDIVQNNWEGATNPGKGGWAILTAHGDIETAGGPVPFKSAPEPAVPQMMAPRIEPTPASPAPSTAARAESPATRISGSMDAALARKMFIVKLCRMAGIKPRLAAQVYSAGWQKPDLLLQTKIQELSSRAGMEPQEAADLIANLRKIPKEKLEYDHDDYKEVFITDVRMVRKIPRESVARWFEAGYRKFEDLRDASADDLMRIDESVPKEDIEELLTGVRVTASK